ncbi:hypothetical protein TNCV_2480541 [Trichonephila clavipes]|nr:hypothetical protein TNCV_2480541 [Trichonephila clavipes]
MKHATPLAFSHPRAKRVCFDKTTGKLLRLNQMLFLRIISHLGSHNYAVVSDFADVARILACADTSSMPLDLSFTYQRWNHCNTFRMVSPRKRIFCNRSSLWDGKNYLLSGLSLTFPNCYRECPHIIMQRYFQQKGLYS